MTHEDFELTKSVVLSRLKGLNPNLTYHNIAHTLDVLEQTIRIARSEGITDPRALSLLRYAALYHDMGFLEIYMGHEKIGSGYFLKDADKFDFTEEEKEIVVDLIMSTRVPQEPKNHLQSILCDADLDYLGRSDYDVIAGRLRKELLEFKFVENDTEWKKMQLTFLKNHAYHTASSRKLREPIKQLNYSRLL